MVLFDYVITHELAHLLHPDHTPAFWSALGHAMLDYEARRERLRRPGAKLVVAKVRPCTRRTRPMLP